MMDTFWQLLVLFFVIFDPFMSFGVFFASTKNMSGKERKKIAILAVLVAAALSYLILFAGEQILSLFSTNLDDFRVAGGIVLGILGLKMILGQSIREPEEHKRSSTGIAAVIGTPLITGPAAITAIMIATNDFGRMATGIAVGIILVFTLLLFLFAARVRKCVGDTAIQIISTLLGLITLSWAVMFIRAGLGF